jgi:uncharacterized membrane protein
MNLAQVITLALLIGTIAFGAWLMNMFFGIIGVVLLILFLLPVFGVMLYFGGGSSGSSNTSTNRRSKGARED